jgi:hypothetical protein
MSKASLYRYHVVLMSQIDMKLYMVSPGIYSGVSCVSAIVTSFRFNHRTSSSTIAYVSCPARSVASLPASSLSQRAHAQGLLAKGIASTFSCGLPPREKLQTTGLVGAKTPKGWWACDGTDDASLPSFVGSEAFGLEPVEAVNRFWVRRT